MKAVLVVWEDAANHEGWADGLDPDTDPVVCHTLGYLVKEDKKSGVLLIAQTISDDNFNNAIQIPRRMVKRIVHISLPRERRTCRTSTTRG